METLLPLCNLPLGSSSKIMELSSVGSMRRRLLDLGFAQGSTVRCIHLAPSGDPIAYSVKGAIIALRKEDAKDILVRVEDSAEAAEGCDLLYELKP
jgi:ferrous iron transport protein A